MRCTHCREDKPASEFAPSAVNWPDRGHWCRVCDRDRRQVNKHGLTVAQKQKIAATQGGCRICGHPEPSVKGWVVDHDHSCCAGEASCPKCRRGVICQWCNTVLGSAFDRVEILRAAVDYLEADRSCGWHEPVACAPGICGSDMRPAGARTESTQSTYEETSYVERSSYESNARGSGEPIDLIGVGR